MPTVVSQIRFSEKAKEELLLDTENKVQCLLGKNEIAVCYYKNIDFAENYMLTSLAYNKESKEISLSIKSNLPLEYIANYILLDTNKYKLPELGKIEPESMLKDNKDIKELFKNGLKIDVKKVDYNILDS